MWSALSNPYISTLHIQSISIFHSTVAFTFSHRDVWGLIIRNLSRAIIDNYQTGKFPLPFFPDEKIDNIQNGNQKINTRRNKTVCEATRFGKRLYSGFRLLSILRHSCSSSPSTFFLWNSRKITHNPSWEVALWKSKSKHIVTEDFLSEAKFQKWITESDLGHVKRIGSSINQRLGLYPRFYFFPRALLCCVLVLSSYFIGTRVCMILFCLLYECCFLFVDSLYSI